MASSASRSPKKQLALGSPVDAISGVGPKQQGLLAKLGIYTVQDLLNHLPRGYEDRSAVVPLSSVRFHGRDQRARVNTIVRVVDHQFFPFRGKQTLKVIVDDGTDHGELLCFNRPFLARSLQIGGEYRLYGQCQVRGKTIQSASFETSPLGKNDQDFSRILPVYPLSAGLTQGAMRKLMARTLDALGSFEDPIPLRIRELHQFHRLDHAYSSVHFPENFDKAESARSSLALVELLVMTTAVRQRMLQERVEVRSPAPPPLSLFNRALEALPFQLTGDQRRTVDEVFADLALAHPMNRLLQGDVGSGKTAVAFLAMTPVIERGYQCAFLAPTESLARQQAEAAHRLFSPLGIETALLVGSVAQSGRKAVVERIAAGDIQVVVGTHSLFSEDVQYAKLGMVVVDEQHRFGVAQREALVAKGPHPDLLMLSATPIPQSLALGFFDPDQMSAIKTMPPGRQGIRTLIYQQGNEDELHRLMDQELDRGHQVYYVLPAVDGGEGSGELRSAQAMYPGLSRRFGRHSVALVHGQMPSGEQTEVLEGFRRGDIQMLVATTVIEVGIDVAKATVMVIDHAESFGLASLHQLRGRVGRSELQSYCVLLFQSEEAQALSDSAKARLKTIHSTVDGFEVAEADLELRGPGEFLGREQAGWLKLRCADLQRDREILARARTLAEDLLQDDPSLTLPDHRLLRSMVQRWRATREVAP